MFFSFSFILSIINRQYFFKEELLKGNKSILLSHYASTCKRELKGFEFFFTLFN